MSIEIKIIDRDKGGYLLEYKKRIINKSPKASAKLVEKARAIGIEARIIKHSSGAHRKHHPCGSMFSPQKCVILNNIRMSVGQARQYITAREKEKGVTL